MKVHERVAEKLAELGVAHAFGVIGSGNYAVTRGLVERGVRYTAARHEGGAAAMADAFARLSGTVPVLTVHQGCGLTNAVTGIGEAAKSGTPMLVLAAEPAAAAVHSNFRIAQDRLVESVGAVSMRITAGSAVRDIVLAHRTALARGVPVLVNLPLDVQAAESTEPDTPPHVPQDAPEASAADVARLAGLLARARRPVLIAGRGGRGAGPELRRLAEASGALLATSAVARGLFQGDPFDLDVSGGFSTPLAAELIGGADLLVSFGCALNMWTMRHGELVGPDTTVVQVDLDPLAPGRHRPVDLGVVGDAALTARAVTAALAADGAKESYRTEEVRARIEGEGRWRKVPYEDLGTAPGTGSATPGRIDPRTLTIALDRMLDRDRVLAVDSGNFLGYPTMFLDVPDEFGLCFSQAFQSVGLGLPSAIGAALAQPGRLPVCGTGDGGLLMAAAELETVVRLGLPMVVIVYNDAAYGAEIHHFGRTEADAGFVTFPDADLSAVARGYGFAAVTVRGPEDLSGVADWLAGPRDRPLLIDAKVADGEPSWWLAEAFKGH
ncbi:thiamine pyrophosphate-dependent acetolactate synthase large subunit-like protein [Actinocorallia herbida]|uniref:Thiamine pyrophosphate-dependent acetolactate synthase large subunit-like protein n=1 Tax=Actinocorallia herbida TaxID=58109 RepID=A0A3N1DC20_9ACTN|nr:thiamine pyrophosphate-binding protein [Actinocorallia herbida]ROO91073.1 thiamine pyrophosphate-dependent acetolactate synthase large subunit-like protein [Actinocorallia herbida]